jgi:hypothetical protein
MGKGRKDEMTKPSLSFLVHNGMTAIEQGNTVMALLFFQDAALQAKTPTVVSCLGYCLASEHGQLQKGIALCQEALQKEPGNALHYLNLGRIYLLAKQKPLALQAFRRGVKCPGNQKIVDELKRLGVRKEPVFAALPRQSVLNRYFGILFHRLGLR